MIEDGVGDVQFQYIRNPKNGWNPNPQFCVISLWKIKPKGLTFKNKCPKGKNFEGFYEEKSVGLLFRSYHRLSVVELWETWFCANTWWTECDWVVLFSLLKVEFSANSLAHLQVVENLIGGGGGGCVQKWDAPSWMVLMYRHMST